MILKQLWLLFLGLFIVAVAVLAIFLFWTNFTIDLTSLQPRINKTLSDALKRPVEIQGPSQLVLSFKPTLLVNNIQLPSTQDGQKPIRIQAIEINVDLSNMSIGDWGRLLRLHTVLPADIRVTLGNTTLTADGTITYQDDQFSSDLAISLNGQHLNDINFVSAEPLMDIGPYSIEVNLQQQQQSIHLLNIIAQFKDTILKGDIRYDNVQQRHLIKANLETPTLIIPPLTMTQSQNKTLEIPSATAMLRDIDFDLNVKADSIQYQDNQLNDFELQLAYERGKTKEAQIKSNINNTPVSLNFSLDLQDLISKAGNADPAKIGTTIQLSAATHQVDLQGALYYPADPINFNFNTAIKGKNLDNLSDFFKTPIPFIKKYAIEASLVGKNNEYHLADISAHVDKTKLTGKIALNIASSRPTIKAKMDIDYLPVEKMMNTVNQIDNQSNIQIDNPSNNQTDKNQGTSFLDTIDAEFDLNIGKLPSEFLVLHNIALTGKLNKGQLTPVNFGFNTGKTRYSGQLSFLTNKGAPKGSNNKSTPKSSELKLSLQAENFHLSEIAIVTHYWDFFDIESPHANLSLTSQGDSLLELFKATSITLNASTGKFVLLDQTENTSESWPLKDITSNITPKSVNVTAVVAHGETPLEYQFRFNRPNILAIPTEPLDFELTLLGSNSQLNIKMISPLPFDWQQQLYFGELEGNNLSDLNTLLGAKLPQLGPYSLTAKMNFPNNGIELSDATATINDSVFEGKFLFKATNDEPIIRATINSDFVNLDDMVPKSFHTKPSENAKNKPSEKDVDRPVVHLLREIHQNLGSKNILIDLNINNIKTEGIELKKMNITLESGHNKVKFSPIEVSYLDGKISSNMLLNLEDNQLDFNVTAQIDNLDYSFLSIYIEKETSEIKGTLSSNIKLSSKSPSYEQLTNNLNGHFNLIAWPEITGNYMLEVWGQGILSATFATFIPGKEHKFNCVVGYFDIENGIMQSKAFYLDTSRFVVDGKGSIDLVNRQLDFVIQPEAKRTQFLTNEVPIQITGPFNDFKIQPQGGIVKGGIFGSIVRVPKNIITFPYRAVADITVSEGSRINCEGVN